MFRKTRTSGDNKCTITVTKSTLTISHIPTATLLYSENSSVFAFVLALSSAFKLVRVLSCDLTGYEANMRHSHV